MKKAGWNTAWMNSAGCVSRNFPRLMSSSNQNLGAWSRPVVQPAIAFEDFRRDPEHHPLNTPSGKIEIFSKQLYDLGQPEEIPAHTQIYPGMGKSIRRPLPTETACNAGEARALEDRE